MAQAELRSEAIRPTSLPRPVPIFAPRPPDVAAAVALALSDHGAGYRPLVLPANARTAKYVAYYSRHPDGRRELSIWLSRARAHAGMIEGTLTRQGLPSELLAVAFVESGLDPHAVSRAGAVGMWQLVEDTARLHGLVIDGTVDERRSPPLATLAAARHLGYLFTSFRDWPMALAAYNAGAARLERLAQATGSRSFWVLAARSAELPEETVDYVPKVLALASLLHDLPRYGFATLTPHADDGEHTHGPTESVAASVLAAYTGDGRWRMCDGRRVSDVNVMQPCSRVETAIRRR